MKIKVRTAPHAMVVDTVALDRGIRRYIGRKFTDSVGPAGGWIEEADPVLVENTADIRQALKDGDLILVHE